MASTSQGDAGAFNEGDWDALPEPARKLYARMMEVFAGFLEHTDHHVGRLIDTLEELEILDLAQRRVTVRRLGWAEGGLASARLRAVYALLAGGILREADAPAPAPQPVVQTDTGKFLLSALHSRPDPSLRDAIRREVHQELHALHALNGEVIFPGPGAAARTLIHPGYTKPEQAKA
jgi:hypothetical protein